MCHFHRRRKNFRGSRVVDFNHVENIIIRLIGFESEDVEKILTCRLLVVLGILLVVEKVFLLILQSSCCEHLVFLQVLSV